VVDDDPSYRTALVAILELEGIEVATAANGRDGLTALRGIVPDVAIIDLAMPVMTGHQLLARKQVDPLIASIPVIVVSASASVSTLRRHGVTVLQKPVSPERLLGLLRPSGRMNEHATLKGTEDLC